MKVSKQIHFLNSSHGQLTENGSIVNWQTETFLNAFEINSYNEVLPWCCLLILTTPRKLNESWNFHRCLNAEKLSCAW